MRDIRKIVFDDLQLGKVPPQNIEMEVAVLGAIMIESNAIHDIINDLFPDMFYKDSHKEICVAILEIYNNSSNIDLLTVTDQLRKNDKLEECGGVFYITELTSKISSSAHIKAHLLIIKENWLRRKIIEFSSNNQQSAYESKNDVFSDLDEIQTSYMNLSESLIGADNPEIKNATFQSLRNLEEAKDKNVATGINTGFVDADRVSGGWQKGDLVILAARPAMGKTALMLAFAKHAALYKNVLAFSLEMTKEQFINRLLSSEAKVNYEKFRNARELSKAELIEIAKASEKVSELNLSIYEKGGMSLQEIRSRAIIMKKKQGLDLLMIDYLQLMKMPKADTKNGAIEIITKGLKDLAKELDVPIICLSQLSRAVEARGGDKRPMLSDLRDSGAIEQDADSVIFLYRPEYYDITPMDKHGNQMQEGAAEIIWAKNRHGRDGKIYLIFKGEYVSFYDYMDLSTGETQTANF